MGNQIAPGATSETMPLSPAVIVLFLQFYVSRVHSIYSFQHFPRSELEKQEATLEKCKISRQN